MTLKDIATICGCSPSTVSRVVNKGDTKSASSGMQRKIWDAVQSCGYSPNLYAKNLRSRTPVNIAPKEIVCIYGRVSGSFIDPFFGILMHAVEKVAYNRHYLLRFDSINSTPSPDNDDADACSAIILGGNNIEKISKIKNRYRNILYTGLQDYSLNIDQVICSGYQAAYSATEYLISLGHNRICYIGETKNEQRYNAFIDAMKNANLPILRGCTIEADFSPENGYRAVDELIQQKIQFTALFCSNDILAIGALHALKNNRIRVPKDVSIIGINDLETVQHLSPMLTTVKIPINDMGGLAAKLMIDRIENGHQIPTKTILPSMIVERDSCCPPSGTKRK